MIVRVVIIVNDAFNPFVIIIVFFCFKSKMI